MKIYIKKEMATNPNQIRYGVTEATIERLELWQAIDWKKTYQDNSNNATYKLVAKFIEKTDVEIPKIEWALTYLICEMLEEQDYDLFSYIKNRVYLELGKGEII